MRKLSPLEAAKKLYSYDGEEYEQFCKLPENENGMSLFNKYAQIKLSEYCDVISSIDDQLLGDLMAQTQFIFKDDITPKKFTNLTIKIKEELIKILKELYKPNQTEAFTLLERLLGKHNKKLTKYLTEEYVNHFKFRVEHQDKLFRIRLSDKELDNCWHVPFNQRENAYTGRFGVPGHPCLYLGEDIQTCLCELCDFEKKGQKENRYVGVFMPKGQILCFDLRLNSGLAEENIDSNELIYLLLTYPVRFLCSVKALHKSSYFCEEYLFSQAFMSLMMHPMDDEKLYMAQYHGIIYDSTKNKGGVNYALYAKSEEYPPRADEIYSNRLMSLFEHSKPEIVKK